MSKTRLSLVVSSTQSSARLTHVEAVAFVPDVTARLSHVEAGLPGGIAQLTYVEAGIDVRGTTARLSHVQAGMPQSGMWVSPGGTGDDWVPTTVFTYTGEAVTEPPAPQGWRRVGVS